MYIHALKTSVGIYLNNLFCDNDITYYYSKNLDSRWYLEISALKFVKSTSLIFSCTVLFLRIKFVCLFVFNEKKASMEICQMGKGVNLSSTDVCKSHHSKRKKNIGKLYFFLYLEFFFSKHKKEKDGHWWSKEGRQDKKGENSESM